MFSSKLEDKDNSLQEKGEEGRTAEAHVNWPGPQSNVFGAGTVCRGNQSMA